MAAVTTIAATVVACESQQDGEPDLADRSAADIVLIVLDTVRKDRLSTYGYVQPTSPNLDRLRATSVLFTNAYSTGGWTTPAHASIFTGLHPIRHGATQESVGLSADLVTLAETLSEAGYETVGVVGNAMITKKHGFAQGFELYRESWRGVEKRDRDPTSVEFTKQFLAQRRSERPLFLFINLIGAHTPFDSCGESCGEFGELPSPGRSDTNWEAYYLGRKRFDARQLDRLSRLYDAEVREVDRHLGQLIEALDTRPAAPGAARPTLLAIVSDHGENIGEHGHVNHVFSLFETTIQIPFLIRYPGHLEPGTENANLVQLHDLHPTLLHAAGVEARGVESHGRNLLLDEVRSEPIIVEYYRPDQAMRRLDVLATEEEKRALRRLDRRIRTVSDGRWKLIWRSDGEHSLYHIEADPDEQLDLIDSPEASERLASLMDRLDRFVEDERSHGSVVPWQGEPLDDETRQELRALGYLE